MTFDWCELRVMVMNSTYSTMWDLRDKQTFLLEVPLFLHLSSDTLSAVASQLRVQRAVDGEFLFVAGTAAHAVNILAEGRIKVVRETEAGQEVILRMIQPGELFGGAGGWGEELYPASAVAIGSAVVLRLPARSFTSLVAGYPDFAVAVIHEIAGRLRLAERRIEELQTQRVERRIAHTLLRLAEKTGVKTASGIRIDIPLSRQDLADMAGTTLSTASRSLSNWDHQGLISAGRERVTILQAHRLFAIAEDLQNECPDDG